MEKITHIRFLVSHAEAGVLFKKAGSTINDVQTQSGAQIFLSHTRELFPGTHDRIVTVSGAVDETLEAVYLILSTLLEEFGSVNSYGEESPSILQMIVPSSSCGGLIGKGDANIRSFEKESEADIVVSPQDNTYHGTPDYRLVLIDGTVEAKMVAIDLILSKLAEDPSYAPMLIAAFPYAREGPKMHRSGKAEKKNARLTKLKCNLCALSFKMFDGRLNHQTESHSDCPFVCPKNTCKLRYKTSIQRDKCTHVVT